MRAGDRRAERPSCADRAFDTGDHSPDRRGGARYASRRGRTVGLHEWQTPELTPLHTGSRSLRPRVGDGVGRNAGEGGGEIAHAAAEPRSTAALFRSRQAAEEMALQGVVHGVDRIEPVHRRRRFALGGEPGQRPPDLRPVKAVERVEQRLQIGVRRRRARGRAQRAERQAGALLVATSGSVQYLPRTVNCGLPKSHRNYRALRLQQLSVTKRSASAKTDRPRVRRPGGASPAWPSCDPISRVLSVMLSGATIASSSGKPELSCLRDRGVARNRRPPSAEPKDRRGIRNQASSRSPPFRPVAGCLRRPVDGGHGPRSEDCPLFHPVIAQRTGAKSARATSVPAGKRPLTNRL